MFALSAARGPFAEILKLLGLCPRAAADGALRHFGTPKFLLMFRAIARAQTRAQDRRRASNARTRSHIACRRERPLAVEAGQGAAGCMRSVAKRSCRFALNIGMKGGPNVRRDSTRQTSRRSGRACPGGRPADRR